MKRLRKGTIAARLVRTFCVLALLALPGAMLAADESSSFSKGVIDVGMVVKNADKTAEFLTQGIGFQEVKGFSVKPELGKKIGLIDGHGCDVRVFNLPGQEQPTNIKVLSFPAVKASQPDQKFIHSTLGFRYFTIYVKDMKAAVAKLKAAKIKLEGETPLDLGGGTYIAVVRDPDGNFFELIGPMPK